jgi:CPA2 family monovalent cation:H+ antiporter-2/glutathione-regulated potassium-efflux system protein KefB
MEIELFYHAMLYLAAAVVFVPIAKKIGIGSILGYLIAGMVIGPYVLGFVGKEGEEVMHFAEFGVVMMLFLIGLELDPSRLWRMRVSILGLGGLQMVFTAIVVAAVSLGIGLKWNQSVAMGLILAMSSTAIVLQTLNEKGLLHSHEGQGSFSVLLFQDVAVIPILAFLPLLALSGGSADTELNDDSLIANYSGWLQTVAVLGAVAIVIFAGRLLLRPLLRWIASTHLTELFTATALLIVVGITVLMSLVGISPALGAFLGGVVLANSEYRHELESDIEPFKGLLLGLFFLTVGASVNFPLVTENIGLILGLVMAVVSVKTIILYFLARWFKNDLKQSLTIAFSLSQVGEFSFVLLTASQRVNIFPAETISLMLAVAALSMAITPLIMLFNEKLILPRLDKKENKEDQKDHDSIDEQNKVIIAGFGRVGNIVGRFLKANGVNTTVLDLDGERVTLLRRLGLKVYFGDATRHSLLKAAGADNAELIIITLDTPEKCLDVIQTVKKHFPNLHILVRAYDRSDAYEFMDEGILHIYRETLDSSLRIGTDALKLLGFRLYQAQRVAYTFRKYDEKALKHLSSIRNDHQKYMDLTREKISELEDFILADMRQEEESRDSGWDADSLRQEAHETGKKNIQK